MGVAQFGDVASVYSLNPGKLPGHFSYKRPGYEASSNLAPCRKMRGHWRLWLRVTNISFDLVTLRLRWFDFAQLPTRSYSNLFIHMTIFHTAKCKYNKMVFLTSSNASKHVLLSLMPIVQPGTPWRRNSPGFRPSLASCILHSVPCETNICPCFLSSIAKRRKMSSKCCRVCH